MRFILILFSCCFITITFAQEVSPSVNASAGGVIQTSKYQIDWTLGEMSTSHFVYEDLLVTEGFHQPFLKIEKLFSATDLTTLGIHQKTETGLDFQSSITPNPFSSILNIKVNSLLYHELQYELLDLQGKSIIPRTTFLANASTTLQLDNIASGIYLLQIFTNKGQQLESHKVVRSY